ncbi:hypothetical protein ACVVIH_13105 [Chryseobacterium arthrosphaerae]
MQATSISVGNSSLSLTYDKTNKLLTGTTFFVVMVDDIGDEPANNFYVSYYSEIFFEFTPGGVNAPLPKKVVVSISDSSFDLAVGNYTFDLTFTSGLAQDVIIPIYLNVIESEDPGSGGEPPRDYKLKYFLENEPYSGQVFRCEIHQDQYKGEPIEIEGRCELKYQDKTDHFQPISASSITMTLMANAALSLQDLYSEDEKSYKVYLKRNDQIIFIGYLKPDGIFEDYVSDRWELSVDAYDGLSILKNMSFSGENGAPFSGKYTAFSIIYNCLKKTGLDLPINVSCRVFYETWNGNENTLYQMYLNADRYYPGNSDSMDCESVIKSILQLFNATLIQHNGEWFIYRSIDLNELGTLFIRYVDGLKENEYYLNPKSTIGSQINNFEIFHCNSNQKKSIAPSVQAFRVTYQYGNANSVFLNSELKLSGSGLNIDGWYVENVDGMVYRNDSGYGLSSKTFTGNSDPLLISLNQSIDINEGAVIKLIIRFANENINSVGLRFAIKVGNKFFNIDDGQWQDNGVINFIANYSFEGYYPGGEKKCKGLGDATYELVVKSPVSGNLVLSIYRDRHPLGAGDFKIYSVNVIPNDSGNIKGRDYTAQRIKKISSVTKPNITLYNGDSVSDLFVGTIYKSDADTPTEKWFRHGESSPPKELLSINAEDNLRLSPRPMIIFEGDVYGYIPFISFIRIDNLNDKKFQPTSYSFDTSTGILSLTSREFSSDYLEEGKDYRVDVKDNYGNETKVTIV